MSGALDRRAVVAALLHDRRDLLVVSGLGSASYDVMAVSDHPLNYYLWGAMGAAATVGFGLAMAQPARPVLVLTGDGEMLMGLGALASIGQKRPKNLSIGVLDNQHYGETGMQKSHTARGISLPGIAKACGFDWAGDIEGMAEVTAFGDRARRREGTLLASIRIAAENPPRVLPPRDGVEIKNRFRRELGFGTI